MGSAPLKDYATALYDQLRAMARARMGGQRAGHTLDPTGLANEALVRLLKCDAARVNDEARGVTQNHASGEWRKGGASEPLIGRRSSLVACSRNPGVAHNRIDVAGRLYPCAGVYAVVETAGTMRAGDRVSLV